MADQGSAVYDDDLTFTDERGGTHCGALTKEAFERCRKKAEVVVVRHHEPFIAFD